jgi:uncharacterized protein YndB with AHSA1/START domain
MVRARHWRILLVLWTAVGGMGVTQAAESEPRMLFKEIVIDAPLADVWNAWTTADGLEFVSSKSNVELRVGGPYEWFLDLPPDARGRRGGEGARVLAFLPRQMLAFDWTFPPAVPTLRESDARTQVVVLLDEVEDGTRVRFTQHGWQEGEDWDAGYDYFDKAWDYVLLSMKEHLEP